MAISDSQYTDWLSSPSAVRCVLVEAVVNSGGSEVTRYMSNKGYVTGSSDTPSNTVYKPIVLSGVKLSETLSLDSQPRLSFGGIELDNTNGSLDSWILEAWENRPISVFYGDMRWARSDFRQVFKGTISGVDSQKKSSITIMIRDDLQKLNVSVYSDVLGGSSLNSNKLIPLCFGECFNITPLLIDHVTHQYKVHDSAINRFIEIRDNGVPVDIVDTPSSELTTGLATGTFKLKASPAGIITASVQGDAVANFNPVDIVTRLVQNYGTTTSRTVNIDTTNFNLFKAANPYPVGIYLDDKSNLLDTCQKVIGSVGGQIAMSRNGYLQILRIDFPPSGTPTAVTKRHIVEGTLEVDTRLPVMGSVKLAYCKNFTKQDNLQTAIPEKHKAAYSEEWLTSSVVDSTVVATYKQSSISDQEETYLLTNSDAQTEAGRRLNVVKQQRIVYRMTCYASMLQLSLGQAVTLTHNRFGLSSGKTGVVVGLEPDWTENKIIVKVMV